MWTTHKPHTFTPYGDRKRKNCFWQRYRHVKNRCRSTKVADQISTLLRKTLPSASISLYGVNKPYSFESRQLSTTQSSILLVSWLRFKHQHQREPDLNNRLPTIFFYVTKGDSPGTSIKLQGVTTFQLLREAEITTTRSSWIGRSA